MNYKKFFDIVRRDLFNGRLSARQVDGMNRIVAFRDDEWPRMIDEELAYLLATVKWETGHSMQPVEEGYPKTGSQLKAYQRSLRYWPWFGRGLVQITWENNYKKFGISIPEEALEWPTALKILFEGCVKGMFTGHKLSDYITKNNQDYVGARRVVNAQDKAEKISDYAVKFLFALRMAKEGETAVPKPLESVVNGVPSTVLGVIALVISALKSYGINLGIPDFHGWVFIGVIGLLLIFFVGARTKTNSPEAIQVDANDEPQEAGMNIINAVRIIHTLVPILEKIIEELAQIKSENNELRSIVGNSKSNPETEADDNSIIDRIGNLADRVNKIVERDNG